MKKTLFVMFALASFTALWAQNPTAGNGTKKSYDIASPDGKVKVEISVGPENITYRVTHDGDEIIAPSPLSMTLADGTGYGIDPKTRSVSRRALDQTITSPVYKKSSVRDNCNELTLRFRGGYDIVFRAYDDGAAYRFVSSADKPFEVTAEEAVFNFPAGSRAWVPYVKRGKTFEEQNFNSFENWYEHISLDRWRKERLAFMPLLVDVGGGKKACITEADLLDYPGMFLYNGDGGFSVKGVFARYPKTVEQGGHNNLQMLVGEREDYIARYDRGTQFPWRVIVVSENDAQLADSDMVYRLASPDRTGDTSWIKPGKVAWDWWNTWNLYGVDFETGINNETYKYYIDFAAEHGIEYVILDEGWAVNLQADLMRVVPEIDLPMLVGYAAERNVGIILWAGYWAFDRDMENICRHYSQMGVKGFKVDFMDRDDQQMVDFHRRAAETAARYKMLVDFHGTYKPTGLQRTYPNTINFEGVNGLEQLKWSKEIDQVTYDVTIPFVRMVAGPMDYTQGAMQNATKKNYAPIYSEAMSQGTRCRQLAQYVVFESPLNMLCDSPSNYERETECTEFIAAVPTVWDETVVLDGKVAEYIVTARRSGAEWYVGGMTGWNPREMEIDLSFIGEGEYSVEMFADGVNASKAARDYRKCVSDVPADRKLTVKMALGGGFAARIYKK